MSDQPHAILTVSAMSAADSFAIEQGVDGRRLMQSAGTGVARAIMSRWAPRSAAVLCGPGNNGGDGWVVGEQLRQAGWAVTIYSAVDRQNLTGDAATCAQEWTGDIHALSDCA